MPQVDVNYWAVLVSAIVAMVIGAIWYSPMLFAKAWMEDTGKKNMDPNQGATAGYVAAFVGNLVMAYIMTHFISYANATTVSMGLMTGFWIWLGFVATGTMMNYIFEGRPWRLFWINTGMQLVILAVTGAILAVWR